MRVTAWVATKAIVMRALAWMHEQGLARLYYERAVGVHNDDVTTVRDIAVGVDVVEFAGEMGTIG